MTEKSTDAVGMVFPCQIGVKIFISNDQTEELFIRKFVTQHLDDKHLNGWSSRESSGGKYLAITAQVEAQSREHIDKFYEVLCAHERVIMAI